MTDVEMKDASKKDQPVEEKKVEKEPDDIFYGEEFMTF
jgi:hypothetical protein